MEEVGLGLVDAVDRLEDQVAVRVDPRLVLGDPALVDEGLHERVVVGQLRERAVAEEVGAAVADVAHAEARRRRRARTVAVVLVPLSAGSSSTSSPIRSWARCRAPATWPSRSSVGCCVEPPQLLHGRAGRDVAAGGSAHAVADREQPGSGVPGVLVVLADPADVGDRGVVEAERQSGRPVLATSAARGSSCRSRTWVPRVRVVGWVIRTLPM